PGPSLFPDGGQPPVGRTTRLLRPHVHAHADAVAGVVVGARGVLAPGVFIGHVVLADGTFVGVTAVAVAVRLRIAHRDVAVAGAARAAVGIVDAAPGHAAD